MTSKIIQQYYNTIRWSIYTGRGPGVRDMPSKILQQYYNTIRWSIYTGRGPDVLTDTDTA